MKKILLALALFLAPSIAMAQCNGVFQNGQVCGNASGAPALPKPTAATVFPAASPGGANGAIQYNNGGLFGGFTMSGDVETNTSTGVTTIQPGVVTNTKLATGAANTMKGSLNGSTTSDIALVACSAVYQLTQWISGTGWQCGNQSTLPSRAIASSLNLSAQTALNTQGYTTAGDAGGAYFLNVGTAPFIDSFITAVSINNVGVSCTNGTYQDIFFSGGTGGGAQGNGVVSGGVLTSINITTPGNAYSVNDILTVNGSIPCTTPPSIKVTSISAPLCSFTDSVGNHFQLVFQTVLEVRQCGAKVNWNLTTGDSAANDDTASIQAALNFAYANTASTSGAGILGAGGLLGNKVDSPEGWSMITSTIVIPQGVMWFGQGEWSSGIQLANSFPPADQGIIFCDPNVQVACFGSYMEGFYIQDCRTCTANSGTNLIFSNSIQQGYFLRKIVTAGVVRGCIALNIGYGGAAMVGMQDVEAGSPASTNCISISYGNAQVRMDSIIIESAVAGVPAAGLAITSGNVLLTGFHCESYSNCIFIDTTEGYNRLQNLTGGGSGCTNLVSRSGGNANASVIANAAKNGCTNTLNNNGSTTSTDIVADVVF